MKIEIANVLSFIAIIASSYSVYSNYRMNEKLSRYNAVNSIYDEAAKVIHEFVEYTDELVDKYKSFDPEVFPKNEKIKMNEIISKINLLIKKLYILMPDEHYDLIKKTISAEERFKLGTLESNFLDAMRRTQFPRTKEVVESDLKHLKKV